MQKNCEKEQRFSCTCFHLQFSLLLTSYIRWFICDNYETILIHYYYLKYMFYSYFLRFYLMVFFYPRIPSKLPHYIYVSLGFSWLWEFLRLSSFWMTVLRNTGPLFCRISFNWDLSVFFMIGLGLWMVERKIRVKVPFSLTISKGSAWLIPVNTDLDRLWSCLLGFSSVTCLVSHVSILFTL